MSSKRKWDQPADNNAHKAQRADDGKSASEAAAAAAAASAIAAKITAQFATSSGGGGGATGVLLGPRDQYDGAFVHDVDINDVRNRYLLTRASTQEEIREETGASVTTKGVWYPDRSKATDRDPPLYLHISASSQEALDKAAKKVEELIAMDMGSLVENKDVRKERVSSRVFQFWIKHGLTDFGFDRENGQKQNYQLDLNRYGISTCAQELLGQRVCSSSTSSKRRIRVYKSRASGPVLSTTKPTVSRMSLCTFISRMFISPGYVNWTNRIKGSGRGSSRSCEGVDRGSSRSCPYRAW